MATVEGRTTYRFRKLSALLRAQRRDCCICLQPIDYDAEPRTPSSFSVQHILSWRDYPHLREVFSNLDAAHFKCNRDDADQGEGYQLGPDADDQW